MDELACGPFPGSCWAQALSMVDGLLQIRGSCSQAPCLTKACIFTIVHLIVITSDFAQWQLWRLRKIWLPVGVPLPRSSTCLSRCPANVFQGKLLLHWTSQVVLVWTQMPKIPSEFFCPWNPCL